jgi:hypothetical protein
MQQKYCNPQISLSLGHAMVSRIAYDWTSNKFEGVPRVS